MRSGDELADLLGVGARDFLVLEQPLADVEQPCLVKCEIRPGLAPCSITAVGPGLCPARRSSRRTFMCRQ